MIRASRLAVLLAGLAAAAPAAARERSEIPEKYRWNLADLYPSDAAWRAARCLPCLALPLAMMVPS